MLSEATPATGSLGSLIGLLLLLGCEEPVPWAAPEVAGADAGKAALAAADSAPSAPSAPAARPPSPLQARRLARFDRFLPEAVRGPLLKVMQEIPFDEGGLSKHPSLEFQSAESAFESLTRKTRKIFAENRVHLFAGERFDFWMLRQSARDMVVRKEHVRTERFAIVVDHASIPAMSYYLQFQPGPVAPGQMRRPMGLTSKCFQCHPSGPRVLRPQRSRLFPSLDQAQQKLLAKWNELIASYRVVETHVPPVPNGSGGKGSAEGGDDEAGAGGPVPPARPAGFSAAVEEQGLRFEEPIQLDELKHETCSECHSRSSGVRAPLLRQHAPAIMSMLNLNRHRQFQERRYQPGTVFPHAFDQLRSYKLGPAAAFCIEEWATRAKPKPPPVSGVCNERGEPKAARSTGPKAPSDPGLLARPDAPATFRVDAGASSVSIEVSTPFASITISELGLAGELECTGRPGPSGLPERCAGTIRMDLTTASTGIRLRDHHLRKAVLRTDQFPLARVTLGPTAGADLAPEGGGTVKLGLELAGYDAAYESRVQCAREGSDPKTLRCTILALAVDLRRHRIEPPAFLGATVGEQVTVSGELVLSPAGGKAP